MILSNDSSLLQKKKKLLMSVFKMKDLGEIHWFLGLEITRDRSHRLIHISQACYIKDVLRHFGFLDSRFVSTPVALGLKLPRYETPQVNACQYQSKLGSVMYAMLGTRPDISYAITTLSQYSANPGQEHLTAINRLLRYLGFTRNMGLTYNGNSKEDDVTGYSDLDWAGDPRDCRSVSGFVFKMAGAAVSWSSKKQSSVALSSTEGEYMASTHATKEAVWIQHFLSDLGFSISIPTTLLIDNQGAIALANNPAFHTRTKHIGIHHHFIRECIENKEIALEYIPTNDQLADVFTKALSREKFKKFVKDMGLRE
jgi:hypothetical protein